MQIVSRGQNSSARSSSRSLWPDECTARLDDPANPRCTRSLRRRCPPCGWETRGIQEVFEVFTDDRDHSGTGQPVSPRFSSLLKRRDLLYGWKGPRVQKIIDIIIYDRVWSGAGRPKKFYDIAVEIWCVAQQSVSAPWVSNVVPLWCWITLW